MTQLNYNYDPFSGALLGCEEARESPNDPGVFLTPAFATLAIPPNFGPGQRAVYRSSDGSSVPAAYSDGAWLVEDIPVPAQESENVEVAPATPTIPQSVTMRQARLALLQAGMLNKVNDAVDAMHGPEGDVARIEWQFASTVDRNRPLVQSLAATFGWTDADMDSLFTQAATL